MALTKVTLTGSVDNLKEGFTKVNDIIDDLAAATTGLGASCIGVFDTAGNMAATNVEAALAEVYTDVADAITISDIFAENAATTTGLTWGYKGGLLRKDNVITTVAAGTISLTDDDTNYIEVTTAGSVSRNTTGFTSGRVPLRQVVCASGVQTTSTDKRAWFAPLAVPTTNGQLLVGSTGADPVVATLTGTANEITVTNAAGSITLSVPNPATMTFANTGLHVLDSNASHDLIIKPGSDITADRTLTITTGDADRTITTNQNIDLSTTAYPQFLGLNNGTYNIAIPTNGFGAASKFMMGNSSTIAWFYVNAAPPGWKVTVTGADTVLAVSGGAGLYNANGGTAGGETWANLKAHTHTGPSHTHGLGTMAGPAHTHTLAAGGTTYTTVTSDYGTGIRSIAGVPTATELTGGAGANQHLTDTTGNPTATALDGAMAADGTAASGAQSTADVRPTASIGKLYILDVA